jgi:outer membrane protein assembly factor BamB
MHSLTTDATDRARRKFVMRIFGVFLTTSLLISTLCAAQNWPSFRGPAASGIAEGHALPVAWDVQTSENIAWKTPIPGLGLSSPIIWGDRVFVVTAVRGEGESLLKPGLYGDIASVEKEGVMTWYLYCIDRASGNSLWQRKVYTGKPKVKRHPKSSHANFTPCTNGVVVVVFLGAEGLYCYDMDGKLRWKKDLGTLDWGYYRAPAAQWGGGGSPVIHRQMLILQCDVQKDPFIAALTLSDGAEIWRTPRNEVPTWSTPTIFAGERNAQIIVNGYRHIGGYDIDTGQEIWRMRGGGDIPVPTPIIAHDLVYITNSHGRMSPIYAIHLSATEDISLAPDTSTSDHIAWSYARGGNYMPTPIVYGDYLYCGSDRGKLSCYNARTGELKYQEGLASGTLACCASPVAGDGKIFFTSEKGDVYVVEAGPGFKLLQINKMNETCMASPAISQGSLYFRTRHHLLAVESK